MSSRTVATMTRAWVGGLLGVFACSGAIDDSRSGDPGDPGAPNSSMMPGAPGKPDTGGGPATPIATSTPPRAAGCAGAVDPGFVGLRRLTRAEYDNTVRDLLGDDTRPARAFPNDDSVLAEQGGVSSLLVEKHEAAVGRLVEAAWAREVAGKQPAAAKLQTCALAAKDVACGRAIVSAFARRAWRRPVAAAEIAPFAGLVDAAVAAGDDAAAGVKLALEGVLLAPDFLFRVEPDPAAGSRALDGHELAVRLSYLLWGTMPDARLFAQAEAGALSKPAGVADEIRRMLADARGAAFAEGLAAQWLAAANLAVSMPDAGKFPAWDEAMRASMAAETVRLLRAFIDEGRDVRGLLDADFTFADERLAKHYGVTLPAGAAGELRRVSLPPGPRRGVLAHAGVLTMTSSPGTTSPVKRGKWVLSQILCSKPPPPPPGADVLEKKAADAPTERERLRIHRENPQCAACHNLMDPIGLGLESFDFVGRLRTAYANGAPIDASGELVGGGKFQTFEDLRGLLRQDERIPACVASAVFTQATGRELVSADACAHEGVVAAFTAGGGKLTDLVIALAASPAFTHKRAEVTGGAP